MMIVTLPLFRFMILCFWKTTLLQVKSVNSGASVSENNDETITFSIFVWKIGRFEFDTLCEKD